MKKLFSIFFALALLLPVSTQAQLLDAVNDSPEGGTIPPKANLISSRNNAPTATMGATGVTASWTWAEYYTGGVFGTTGSLTSTHYWWSRNASGSGYPRVHLYFLFTTGTGATYSYNHPTDGDISVPVPAKGSYTIRSSSTNMTVFNYDFKWNGSYKNSLAYGNSSSYYSNMQSGTVTVAEGADGPYIVASGKTPENYNFSCTIGSAAQYKSVGVGVNDNSMGTATISYVSGYVYTPTTHYKLNSVYRITATPNDGYMFVNWSDGSTEATRNITITGNATYTANFEAIPAGTGTITTAVNNSSYGSVTAGGEYEIGQEITISATANEGYQFYQWQDGSTTNPRTITVSGDATYTATFKALYTLTVNANNDTYGTVTGSGVYMDGTSATLTATVANPIVNSFVRWNDGNTNAERNVTVTGNTTYTAQFSALPTDTIDIPGYSTIIDETASSEHWFQVIGENDHYEVSICINSAAISNTTYANSSFDLDYTTIIFSDINSTEHKATQAQATFSRSGTVYYLTGWLLYNGTVYVVKMKFDNEHLTYDEDAYAYNQTLTLDQISMQTSGNYPNEIWIRGDKEYSSYDNSIHETWDIDDDIQLMFVVGSGKSYIPGGSYEIDDSQDIGTLRACDGSKGSYIYRYQISYTYNASLYWMYRHGTVTVINPNHTPKPMYVYVNGVNSYGRKALITIGTKPALRQVTTSATNGTLTLGCAENHGYNSDASEETGNYYYQGTILTLTPTPAEGYRFNGWSGGTPTDNGDGTYSITVGASDINLTAIFVANTYTLAWDANYGELSGSYTAAGSVNAGASITAPTATRTGYTFTGWSPEFTGYMPAANTTYVAQWTANTHNVSWVTDGNALTGTYTNGTTAYGTTIVAPNTPTKTATAQYTYTFNGWTPAVAATMPDNDVTYTATWTETPVNYTLTWTTDGDALTGTYTSGTVAYGTTIVAPNTPTKTGYTFAGWDVTPASTMPAANTTYTAQWTANTYTITYRDQNDEAYSGSNLASLPASHTYNEATALVNGTKDGYNFLGWFTDAACTESAGSSIAANSITADITLYAKWEVAARTVTITAPTNGTITVSYNDGSAQSFTSGSRNIAPGTTLTITAVGTSGHDLATLTVGGKAFTSGNTLTLTENITIVATFGITLCESCNNTHYNSFLDNDGRTENVIYNRTFVQGRWSTLCLPFNVSSAQMTNLKMRGRVYEFRYATGNANDGNKVTLYFSAPSSLQAGKCYIVNANNALANRSKSAFVFNNVTINLGADKVADLTIADAYDGLDGYSDPSEKDNKIELVGTLRKGTLLIDESRNTYMGLKENKIYYPNTTSGSTVLAYRGVFRSINGASLEDVMERVRIVVDGEDAGELEVVNGELQAVPEVRKFIRDGVLYIEREGVIYDAAGQRVE